MIRYWTWFQDKSSWANIKPWNVSLIGKLDSLYGKSSPDAQAAGPGPRHHALTSFTTLSASLVPLLENHLLKVKVLHDQDLAARYGHDLHPCASSSRARGSQ